jgi:hypothetical protein
LWIGSVDIATGRTDDTSYSTCVPDVLSNFFVKPVIGERRTGGEKPCDDHTEASTYRPRSRHRRCRHGPDASNRSTGSIASAA